MKISVIIPSYKPQGYVWECLESFCNQTFLKSDYEVIIILNGCKEPHYTWMCKFTARHSDVQWNLLQTDTGGVSNARNLGIDAAKGEYVTFVDDDDKVSPSFLKRLYEKAAPETISLCRPYAFIDGDESKQAPYGITDVYNRLPVDKKTHPLRARRYFNGPWMKLIHREIIGNRRFDSRIRNGEDGLFMFIISDRIKYVQRAEPDAIYYRRMRQGSAVNRERSRYERLKNSAVIAWEEIRWVCHNPFGYNWYFFLRSIMGLARVGIYK